MQDTLDAYKEGYAKAHTDALDLIYASTRIQFTSVADLIIEIRRFQNRIDMLEQTVVLLKQNIEA